MSGLVLFTEMNCEKCSEIDIKTLPLLWGYQSMEESQSQAANYKIHYRNLFGLISLNQYWNHQIYPWLPWTEYIGISTNPEIQSRARMQRGYSHLQYSCFFIPIQVYSKSSLFTIRTEHSSDLILLFFTYTSPTFSKNSKGKIRFVTL